MKVPSYELDKRVADFQLSLKSKGIDGALLVQRADTLYYTGTAQNVHVYIPAEGKPIVLTYRDFIRAQAESSWAVIPLKGMSKIPAYIQEAGHLLPKTLGLELDVLPVNQFERYRKIFPEVSFVDVSPEIRYQRAVKSNWERNRLEESAKILPEVLEYAKNILRPGMTEIELEGLLEGKARALGHGGHVRMRGFGSEFHVGAITSGARAAMNSSFDGPVTGKGTSVAHPNGASMDPIKEGEPILVDMVTVYNGYQIDQTRILSLGPLSEELTKAYEITLQVEELIRRALIPGRVAGEVFEEILTWVQENTSYEENFMGYGAGRVRFVGHGVGLELDELPTISKGSKEVLKAGMVIAIEPKFVFPDLGAVGIEDTVIVEGELGAAFLSVTSRNLIIV
ncbi:Xaa-Pro aminopeptidase [Desulfosporosinus orientis DSM 765]|uniref:Xaa-Pro aminopeptidase n=1 Tax=Desulfosporosinus orientis (strain ATCC 19365 / DSM 765 / NCIMB 8382 / VKM B-1628 / Singapore I) TaxID=768706 RepID=G7W7K3_DESOD|nr:Xaa-Pro peptidase family protein [Desulfosporosinus orientis]AET65922.1 Xaa-Pro aminopeptidase [Desulfosporosinus orientis DSM 765]